MLWLVLQNWRLEGFVLSLLGFLCVVEIEVKVHNIWLLYNILLGRVFPFTSGDVAEIQDKAPLSGTEGTEVVSRVFI